MIYFLNFKKMLVRKDSNLMCKGSVYLANVGHVSASSPSGAGLIFSDILPSASKNSLKDILRNLSDVSSSTYVYME